MARKVKMRGAALERLPHEAVGQQIAAPPSAGSDRPLFANPVKPTLN